MSLLVFVFGFFVFAEDAPEAEYPYPNQPVSSEESLNLEKPVKKDAQGTYYYGTSEEKKKKKKPYQGIEQPKKVGSDGTYYYGDSEEAVAEAYEGVEAPMDTDSDGGYYYSRKKKDKPKAKNVYGPKPTRVSADGEYFYRDEPKTAKNTFVLRFGTLSPPEISASNNTSYDQVYGSNSNFLIAFDYDWQLTGDLFLKLGSGFTTSQGKGQFKSTENQAREPRETFQFFIFPNTLTVSYKGAIWDSQIFTPYLEGGPGYFTFLEKRSDGDFFSFDGETTKLGGAFVLSAAAGLLISTTKWTAGSGLLSDYGATQSWFDLQFKQIIGLDKRKDFTSSIITAGFAIGF